MELLDSPLGVKRKIEIVGFLEWNNTQKFLVAQFYVQSIDSQGNLLTDKVINQNREVTYLLNNTSRVNSQFSPINSGGTGEYDFFFNLIQTVPVTTAITQLAEKLKTRKIFE